MADTKIRINGLVHASSAELTDRYAIDNEDGITQSVSGQNIADMVATTEFDDLNTEDKTLKGAINELVAGGGGGGSSTFAGLTDVDIDTQTLANGQVPKYNSTTQKWENANESGGGTSSYFTVEVEDNQSTGNLEVVTSADDILDAFLHDVPIVAKYGSNTYTLMGAYEQTGVSLTFISVDGYQENLIEIDGFHVYLTESQGVWSASADPLEISNDIKIPRVYTSTLTAGNTSITISADVRSSSLIDVYTDTWGVNPTNVVADTTNDTITLTFAARSSDLDVKVEVIY